MDIEASSVDNDMPIIGDKEILQQGHNETGSNENGNDDGNDDNGNNDDNEKVLDETQGSPLRINPDESYVVVAEVQRQQTNDGTAMQEEKEEEHHSKDLTKNTIDHENEHENNKTQQKNTTITNNSSNNDTATQNDVDLASKVTDVIETDPSSPELLMINETERSTIETTRTDTPSTQDNVAKVATVAPEAIINNPVAQNVALANKNEATAQNSQQYLVIEQFAEENIFNTKEELKGLLLRYHHAIDRSYKVKESHPKHYQVICSCAKPKKANNNKNTDSQSSVTTAPDEGECPFRVRVVYEESIRKWKISKSIPFHTCRSSGRKRNYSGSTLKLAYGDVLSEFTIPQTVNGKTSLPHGAIKKSIKELKKLTEEAYGHALGVSQAQKVIARMRDTRLEAIVGHYHLLHGFISNLKVKDPSGTFILESKPCVWKRPLKQFHRLYVAFSAMKHAWEVGSIKVMLLPPPLPLVNMICPQLAVACTYDGNNQMLPCAYAIIDQPTSNNWIWFMQKLSADFKDMTLVFGAGTQLEDTFHLKTLIRRHGVAFTWDVYTMMEIYNKELQSTDQQQMLPGKKEEEVVVLIRQLVEARTERGYQCLFDRLKNRLVALVKDDHEDYVNDMLDWLEAKVSQFATYQLLDKSKRRCGLVDTVQLADPIKELLPESLRGLKVLNLLSDLNSNLFDILQERKRTIKQHIDENNQQQKDGHDDGHDDDEEKQEQQPSTQPKELTEYATQKHVICVREASSLPVIVTDHNDQKWAAQVATTDDGRPTCWLYVQVDVETFSISCPCRYYEEFGRPCIHGMALLLCENIKPHDYRWYAKVFRVTTNWEMYDFSIPSDLDSFDRPLQVQELVPPEFIKIQGNNNNNSSSSSSKSNNPDDLQNPRKKPRYQSKSKNPRICSACGEPGHHYTTCSSPSVQHLYEPVQKDSLIHAKSEAKLLFEEGTNQMTAPQDGHDNITA